MLQPNRFPSTDPIVPDAFDYLFGESSLDEETKKSFRKFPKFSDQKDFEILTLVPDTYSLLYETTEEITPQGHDSASENPYTTAIKYFLVEKINVIRAAKGTSLEEVALQELIDVLYSLSLYSHVHVDETLPDDSETLISELREIAEECGEPNWDGYDALPIESRTLELAKRLVYALPEGLPLPEAAPEPDGFISLDWIWSKNRVFSLSIGKTDELSYAWIDNEDRGYGVAKFDGLSVPKRVIETIRGFLP